jgi:Flp pilus assembly protein TadD
VLSPAAKIALDAGNAAYRAKQFGEAIARYREASAASPDHAAPWFGVYMAASEMKNKALADSAMAKVNALSSDAAALNTHAEIAKSGAKPTPK